MGSTSRILEQLKREREQLKKQLSGLNAAISVFVSVYSGAKPKRRRTMSAEARAKIAAAQRKRWAACS